MFASNLVFSRVAKPDMSNDAPAFVLDNITPESLLLNGEYKTKMRNAYIFHLSKCHSKSEKIKSSWKVSCIYYCFLLFLSEAFCCILTKPVFYDCLTRCATNQDVQSQELA